MPKHNPIAKDLEHVLKTLEYNEVVSVLIGTELTDGINSYCDVLKVVDYLKKQKAEHNYLGPNTGVIVADLTAKQVYSLAKRSYIYSIERNGEVKAHEV
ncbi:hypothetical protein HY837_06455 [archaeon]|nr:hypothetical protein [archaeon]